MIGMCKHTGRRIEGMAYLQQRLETLLTTPPVSRVMRRAYGSDVRRLIDRPASAALLIDLYAATALAIRRWEPELRLKRVQAGPGEPGCVVLDLDGDYVDAHSGHGPQAVHLRISPRVLS